MNALETLRSAIPDAAKDLRLNLGSVLQSNTLTKEQIWGTAVACAIAARNPQLRQATLEDALTQVAPEVVEDAKAAAALMGMNNVYYRFRHMVGRDEYAQKPARQRLAQVATNKPDFELFCLAVSAINGCESCVRSHERVVLEGGLSEEQVNDAVRIAATFHGVAVALEM
jgi:alkyl hydroperoxide reductase subunit D